MNFSPIKIYRVLLGAVALVFLTYLLIGPKPWNEGVETVTEGGKSVKAVHHAVTGLWYAALVNFGIVGVLFGIGRWLVLPLNASFVPESAGIGKKSLPLFGLAALVATGLGIYFSGPRLDTSLWGDEETMMKRTVVGEYVRSERGLGEEMKFRESLWSDTFFRYPTPNNHPVASILARINHSVFFDQSDDPDAQYFDEVILRAPGFVAGLLGITAIGWCLACFGFFRAGILVMFLLVLHPWFVRYGSDFRGYAYMFLFLPLALGFLIRGVRSGSWSDFLLFGLFQFLLFYSYFGSIYVMLAMNLSALLAVIFGKGDWAARRVVLGRWFVACCGSAVLAVQLVGPLLPQMREYFSHPHRDNDAVTREWAIDNLSSLASGMPWKAWAYNNPFCEHTSAYHPVSTTLLFGALAIALVLGVVRLIRASRLTALFVIALLLPWFHFVIQATKGVGVLYHWYTIMALPGVLILVALGVEYLPSMVKSVRIRNASAAFAGIVLLTGFAGYTQQARENYRNRPAEPSRDSVALTRSAVNPNHPDSDDVITAGFVMITRGYDPKGYHFRKDDAESFQELIDRARTEKKPMFVNLGLIGFARLHYPKLMAMIEDPSLFDRVEVFYGLDEPCTRYVFRLRE